MQYKYWIYVLFGFEGQWNVDGVEVYVEIVEGFLGNDNYLGEFLLLYFLLIVRGFVVSGFLNVDDLFYWIDEVD